MSKCAKSDNFIFDEMKISCTRLSSPWTEVHVVLKALLQSPQLYYVLWLQKMQFSALIFLGKKWQNCIFLANCTHTYREAIRIQGHHWACTCKIKSSSKGSKKSKVDIFGHFLVSEKVSRPLFIQFRESKKKFCQIPLLQHNLPRIISMILRKMPIFSPSQF